MQPAVSQTITRTQRTSTGSDGHAARFVPVSIVGTAPTTSLELSLGNARVVRLQGAADSKLLRAAIRAAGQLDALRTGDD
jgi:hypothetical protein